jgi:hypothetical protein
VRFVFDVEDDKCSGDDLSDPSWVEADVAERLEGVLSREFPRSPIAQAVVGLVKLLLHKQQPTVLRFLERDGDRLAYLCYRRRPGRCAEWLIQLRSGRPWIPVIS